MPLLTRTGAGLLAAGLSVAGLLPMATASASPLTSDQSVAARSAASSWFADPLSHAARAKLIAVPAVPSRYDGHALRWTRALWRTHSGHLAVPADRAAGHQLAKGQAVTLEAPFASGSAALPKTLRTEVARLKSSLTNATSLRCEGYSGYNTGRPADTSRLSRHRAATVCGALVAGLHAPARTAHHRSPAVRVTTTSAGYGGSRPVVVGGKRSRALTSRAANRRVVVEVTDQGATSGGTTTSSVPGPPTISQVQTADTSVTLGFSAPASNGGSAVTGYEYSTDGWSWHPLTYTGAGPYTATVTGLAHTSTYLMAVRAISALGSGASSNEALVTTLPSLAAAPTLQSVWLSGVMESVSLSWPMPIDDGGSAVTGYQYQVDGGDWTDLPNVTVPVSGNASGYRYGASLPACGSTPSVSLRAVTAIGPGAASEPVTTTVDCSMI